MKPFFPCLYSFSRFFDVVDHSSYYMQIYIYIYMLESAISAALFPQSAMCSNTKYMAYIVYQVIEWYMDYGRLKLGAIKSLPMYALVYL